MVFKSKREMVKDIEASFEEEKVEDVVDEVTEKSGKKSFLPVFIFITFIISIGAAFLGYFLNDQIQNMQQREEERLKRDVSVIKPMSHDLKLSQREVGRHAVLLADHEEGIKTVAIQNKQINVLVDEHTRTLNQHDEALQKSLQDLSRIGQLIEESNSQQQQVNIELKNQIQVWLQAEIDKVMINLAQKEEQLQLLTQQANQSKGKSTPKSDQIVSSESKDIKKASKPNKQIPIVLAKTKAIQPVDKTLIIPDLSLLKLHEARSLVQLTLDSLAYASSKASILSVLDKVQSRLEKLPNTHFVVRQIKDSQRLVNSQLASPLKEHLKILTQLLSTSQSLVVVNEKGKLHLAKEKETDDKAVKASDKTGIELASDKFVNELKSLITFRHTKKKPSHLIAPAEAFVLKQNLALKLEVARLALIEKNINLYHSLLNESLDLLNKYFDSQSAPVLAATNTLLKLLDQPMNNANEKLNYALQGIIQSIDGLIEQLTQTSNTKNLFSGVNN